MGALGVIQNGSSTGAVFLVSWLLGISFIVTGIIKNKALTHNIAKKGGYRTRRSLSSKDAWFFANKLSNKMYIIGGVLGVIASNLVRIFVTNNIYTVIFATIVIELLLQLLTEFILRKTFDEKGRKIKK